MILKPATSQNRPFFIGVTGLTLLISISKDGAGFAAPTNANLVEIGTTGIYNWQAVSADLAGANTLTYLFAGVGLPVLNGIPVDNIGAPIQAVVVQ